MTGSNLAVHASSAQSRGFLTAGPLAAYVQGAGAAGAGAAIGAGAGMSLGSAGGPQDYSHEAGAVPAIAGYSGDASLISTLPNKHRGGYWQSSS